MTEISLTGKLALVTGASTATGRAIATELARQGAAVALHLQPDQAANAETRGVIDAILANGGRATMVTGDVTQVAECFRIVDEVAAWLGGLDILVNHAEMAAPLPLPDVSPDLFEQIVNTNMRGAFFCAQQAVRWMEKRGSGAIVNTGSVASFAGIPNQSLYTLTKGAIAGFTRQLAIELIPNQIRVNAVAPGYLDPDNPTAPAQNSWERVGAPEDLARLVAFVASPAANFITGQILNVDGGLSSRLAIYPPLINTLELTQ